MSIIIINTFVFIVQILYASCSFHACLATCFAVRKLVKRDYALPIDENGKCVVANKILPEDEKVFVQILTLICSVPSCLLTCSLYSLLYKFITPVPALLYVSFPLWGGLPN